MTSTRKSAAAAPADTRPPTAVHPAADPPEPPCGAAPAPPFYEIAEPRLPSPEEVTHA